MAGSRTLKLSILADVDDLNKKLKGATTDVETFGDKMEKVGKVVGAAFVAAAAAAGAYAVKIGVEGVKAAIEDEAAQNRLATALKNATGATNEQIKATEDYILKTELATGKTDTELRSALGRLALSTESTTKAQELLNTALNISASTGKPLEAVANALGKAYDGQTTALGRLGLGLSSAELKGKSFADVQKTLDDRFAGASAAAAETYQGKLDRMNRAFDEAKEAIGTALLPVVQKLLELFTIYVIPVFEKVSNSLSQSGGLGQSIQYVSDVLNKVFVPVWNGLKSAFGNIKDAIDDNKAAFMAFGKLIAEYVAPVVGTVLGGAIKGVGVVVSGVINLIGDVAEVVVKVVNGAISAVNTLIKAYNAIPVLPNIPTIGTISVPQISVPDVSASNIKVPSIPTISAPSVSTSVSSSAATATAMKPTPAPAGPTFASVGATPFTQGMSVASQSPITVAPTINIGVAGDPQGVANTIVDVLTQATARGGMTRRILDL